MMPTEPNVARVLLRVELADGGVREFEACEPYDTEVTVKPAERFTALTDYLTRWPPSLIPAGDADSVTIGFKANPRQRNSITIRTSEAEQREACAACGASSAFWQPQHRQAI